MDFWALMAWFFWCFVFIAYLMVIFSIVGDIFRDRSMNGWLKALWILFLVFVPFLTSLVYLIARGRGMSERSASDARASRSATDDYIRQTAGAPSAAEDIATAHGLLSSGAINQAEFEALKTQALAK